MREVNLVDNRQEGEVRVEGMVEYGECLGLDPFCADMSKILQRKPSLWRG